MPFIESEQEFCARHGGKPLKFKRGVRILPDGAKITDTEFNVFFHEPPAHPERRLQAKRLYWATLLERAEAAFKHCKARIAGGTDDDGNPFRVAWDVAFYGPAPAPHDGAAWLVQLRTVRNQYRQAVKYIDEQYEALPSVRERRAREAEIEALEQGARADAEAKRAEALAITLD